MHVIERYNWIVHIILLGLPFLAVVLNKWVLFLVQLGQKQTRLL